MSELVATTPLEGYTASFEGIALAEIPNLALISIAGMSDGDERLSEVFRSSFSTDWPAVGSSTVSPTTGIRFLGLQSDQIFAMTADSHAPATIANMLGSAFYLTDQSDSWACMEIGGPRCRSVLERLCPIDLAPHAFPDGAVTRTIMEHHGAIVLRVGDEAFFLLTARSSAGSFLHAVEQAARSVAAATASA